MKKGTNNQFSLTNLLWIICLTNVIALLFLPWLKIDSVSWICGSTLSFFNLWYMSFKLESQLYRGEKKARIKGYKDFNLRYLVLIIIAVSAVRFLRLNIIIFGVGLLSGQIWIFILYLISLINSNRTQE